MEVNLPLLDNSRREVLWNYNSGIIDNVNFVPFRCSEGGFNDPVGNCSLVSTNSRYDPKSLSKYPFIEMKSTFSLFHNSIDISCSCDRFIANTFE